MVECLKPEKSRPEMHFVLNILRGKISTRKNSVELYCVGTGTGTTGIDATTWFWSSRSRVDLLCFTYLQAITLRPSLESSEFFPYLHLSALRSYDCKRIVAFYAYLFTHERHVLVQSTGGPLCLTHKKLPQFHVFCLVHVNHHKKDIAHIISDQFRG